MASEIKNPDEYINKLTEDRQIVMSKLRKTILEKLPNGFEETMSYGLPSFVVPLSIYPDGYHCKAATPLPFISLASQKNFVAVYHMGIYANKELMDWFVSEYPKYSNRKLDMGKSCIRFKKIDEIPYELIGDLAERMSVKQWIDIYENTIKR